MTIIFTYGLPTSGKTTFANEIERECNGRNIPCKKASSVENRDKSSTKRFTTQSIDETHPTTRQQKDESYKKLIENA